MKRLVKCVLLSTLMVGVFGCAAKSTEEAAAEARVAAADARLDAADANARVKAADAHVKAADARVDAADAGVAAFKADEHVRTVTRPAATAGTVKSKGTIPSGTVLHVSLIDELATDKNADGDHFLTSLAEPVIVDGRTMLPKGTKIRGRVLGVEDSGRVQGSASLQIALTDVMLNNKTMPITTDTFTATAESSKGRDAGLIAGGAGIGAAIGAIAGGKKGAAIGAIAGGGAGTGTVLATKGKEIRYAPETRLTFILANPVEM
jgi:hypothetical protein